MRFVRPSVVTKDGDVEQGGEEEEEEVEDLRGCEDEMTLGNEEVEGPMSHGTEEPDKLEGTDDGAKFKRMGDPKMPTQREIEEHNAR